MPSWKKLITSGSSAHLNHVTASGNISGSATSTGSFGHGYIDNKLGIGTTSPSKALEVVGDTILTNAWNNVGSDIIIGDYDESGNGLLLQLNDTDKSIFTTYEGANSGLSLDWDNWLFRIGDWDGENNEVLFTVDDDNEKFVFNNGNVGIGTTSPDEPLDILGAGFLKIGWDNSNHLRIGRAASGHFEMQRTCTGAADEVFFQAKEASEGDISFPVGKVGIGTVSPSKLLDVSGSGRFYDDLYIEGGSPNLTWTDQDSGQSNFTIEVNANLWMLGSSDGTYLFNVKNDGNVGIGTTSTETKLHISQSSDTSAIRLSGSGSMGARDAGIYLDSYGQLHIRNNEQSDGLGNPHIYLEALGGGSIYSYGVHRFDDGLDSTGTAPIYIGGSYDANIQLRSSAHSGIMFLDAGTGNVGIGTISPDYKLQVSGAIVPENDNAFDLGTSALRWQDVYSVSTTTGGIFEVGLRTEGLKDLPTGTIVVWNNGKCVPCYKEKDELVMGVTREGKDEPIVLGAELILVTGKVDEGDYILTSKTEGHGKSVKSGYLFKKNLFGKVIGQALESAEGESSLIKCMVRKM